MSEPTALHNTFVIERSYPKPRERVFAAFADPAVKRRWFAEGHSLDLLGYEMDFRVGGAELQRYRFKEGSPFPGVELVSEGRFLDIVPGARIVVAADMAMRGARFSVALVTIELFSTDAGTDLLCTHQGVFFEGADGPAMREAGWRTLFDRLGEVLG
jgi:uncharacterized protein YndB with AHSA1/START domain